jgi:hypothetical protein
MLLMFSFLCALNIASPSAALARDGRGVVMAWENSRKISVARLDGHGDITGPVRTLGDNASDPSIAAWPTGSGFTLAWMEESGSDVRTVYSRLDGELNADAPKQLVLIAYNSAISPAIVRSNAASTWISANNEVWELRADGTLGLPLLTGVPASDMIANGSFPRLVAATKAFDTPGCLDAPGCVTVGGPFNGYCRPDCRISSETGYALKFMADESAVSAVPFTFESEAQPAIQSNGRDIVIAWLRGAQQSGGAVVLDRFSDVRDFDLATRQPELLGTFQPDTGRVRPDIATDGTRYLVVWQYATSTGNHDIRAALFDASGYVTPYTIAATDADEQRPSVIAVRSGSFLIAYEKIRGTDRQIVRQFVTLDGRARAVR